MRKKTVQGKYIREDTGRLIVYNFPPSPGTYSYVCKIYQEYSSDDLGQKEVEGPPVYFHDMKLYLRDVATIMAICQNILSNQLPSDNESTKDSS